MSGRWAGRAAASVSAASVPPTLCGGEYSPGYALLLAQSCRASMVRQLGCKTWETRMNLRIHFFLVSLAALSVGARADDFDFPIPANNGQGYPAAAAPQPVGPPQTG